MPAELEDQLVGAGLKIEDMRPRDVVGGEWCLRVTATAPLDPRARPA